MFPEADKIVLLEEDLEVSPDFISYFDQTYHLLDIDPSLYCVSAWNDHGYNHTVGDPAQLYRIGFLPGLGWMLKRSLFFEELLPKWPPPWTDFDWDVMLRLSEHRKGRDCIIPDISRTYHFGYIGKHVGASMQFKYFYDHAFNTIPDVKLKDVDNMVFHKYEEMLMNALTGSVMVNGLAHDQTSCDGVFAPAPTNKTYVLFIRMQGPEDVGVWEKLSTCLNLWDLDIRGDHRGVWRFWYNGNPVIVVGVPYAELSSFAVHSQGEAVIFGGERSKRATSMGRWPPGLHRDMSEDRVRRFRLSSDAVNKAEADQRADREGEDT
ncbi:protein O-linked-mannose beta-1,2-N-acetylglucosaminyltransferase 1-like [Pollicipes pollicipes]|uniref:protein O-linked-mannose beta-1,2-N-acetylglucosaminyltransferase 1-like n=1 Tax=Pollicipes pollicipes TaxID=41117 RepID=UPI001885A3DF|nr:protein O-linked-mannose beta-1,2-N-acetylglucosaminyltransferase 1-like [Pollicipes pollicipes]